MKSFSLSLFLYLCISVPFTCLGQTSLSKDALKVFVDCQTRCHLQYIQQELTYVNYMRDRQNADVFVQITGQWMGNGGRQYTLEFKGFHRFEGMKDTIQYFTVPNSSDSDQRDQILQAMKSGLLPFLVQTSTLKNISYSVNGQLESDQSETEANDPWRLWTFSLRANAYVSGEESFRNTNLNGRIGFGKVTEDFKWNTNMHYNYSSNFYVIDEDETFRNVVTSKGISSTYVKSISDHISTGAFFSLSESTFSNYNLNFSFQPAIEWNYYPYLEANKRQFTAIYRLGTQFNNYVDSTIFNKTEELLFKHSIEFNFQKIEEWGNIDFEISYGNYLHDWGLLFAFISPEIEINLFKGFSFDMGGNFGWIRNQINLPKEDAGRDDVLLQIRQLKSNYNYFIYAGISYRFGSNFSNIVNVRF